MDDNEISRKDIINDKHAMDGKVDYIKSDGHIKNWQYPNTATTTEWCQSLLKG